MHFLGFITIILHSYETITLVTRDFLVITRFEFIAVHPGTLVQLLVSVLLFQHASRSYLTKESVSVYFSSLQLM